MKDNINNGKKKTFSDNPKLSVVMPVFNGEPFLKDAVESILKQSFKKYEFIIINDGSTDNTVDIIKSYKDGRIKLIENRNNLGIAKCLNIGFELSKGDYIARMDADEISNSERFEKQLAFLEKNKEVGVCGTLTKTLGKKIEKIWMYPLDHERIKANLLFHCCLVHSSVMIRSSIIEDKNIFYSESCPHAEDYELWVRLSRITKIANLGEVLTRYRIHNKSIGAMHSTVQKKTANQIRRKQIEELLRDVSLEEIKFHNQISQTDMDVDNEKLKKTCKWFIKLLNANREKEIYQHNVFTEVLTKRLVKFMRRTKTLSLLTVYDIFRSPFAPYIDIPIVEKISLFSKIIVNSIIHDAKRN